MSIAATSIVLGDRGWLVPAAAVLLAAVAAVGLAYARADWPLVRRVAAAGLKIAGFALLVLCLVEPLWSGLRIKPGENLFLILADNSASLQIADRGGGPSRGDRFRALLADEPDGWQSILGRMFDVRRYTFGERLQSVDRFSELEFDHGRSRLSAAAAQLEERFRDRPVAGVLLLTDGNMTDADATHVPFAGFAPVYPVMWDDPAEALDVALENVTVSRSPFEDAPITIQAETRVSGASDAPLVGQLLRESGELVEELRVPQPQTGRPASMRFQFRPAAPGIEFYRVRVALADQMGQFDDPALSKETVLANNSRLVAVEQDRGPYRVLYVAGRPNWEFKFLRRAIESDPALQLVGLVRIARKEAKFEFRGRAGERGNPLFRGFTDGAADDVETYDEPVIVRLGTRDEAELRAGFPKTREELYDFHALILDDIEAAFFSHDQLSLLEQFVSNRGGSLLMLGGPDTFAHGGYVRTIVEEMLPVYLHRRGEQAAPQGGFRWRLTRDGWLEPWVRLRGNEPDEQQRLAMMPEFRTLNPSPLVKPAARTLAEVRDAAGQVYPALVAQQYGGGRVAAMLVGDAWRWPLARAEGEPNDLGKMWRQMVRWLVAEVPPRIDVAVNAGGDATAAVEIVTRVRDAVYDPVEDAAVTVTIETPDQSTIRLNAEPSLEEPGVFTTVCAVRSDGGYRVEAVVRDSSGNELGRSQTGWTSDPAADEFRKFTVNRELLQSIAERSGGAVLAPESLEGFVRSLPTREAPVMEAWSKPLWHSPWMLLAAVCCFAGEWGLRRWRGLP